MDDAWPLPVDPWEWAGMTVEEFDFHFVRDGHKGTDAQLFQFFAVQHCIALREEIEKDESGFAVLGAVRQCGTYGLVMPDWLVYAFNRRYDAVLNFRALSWDAPESFGRPYPKGTNRVAQRKKRMLQFQVWNEVTRIRKMEPDTPIDGELFERVCGPLNIRVTLASEYYYSVKKKFDMTAPKNSAKITKTAADMTQATPSTSTPQRLLRLPEVCSLVGLGKSSIYDGVKAGTFPAPV
eukprot:gene29531-51547_t